MRATNAIRHPRNLIDLRSVLELCNPLPRVFHAVSEEYVCSVYLITTTIRIKSLLNFRVLSHIDFWEDKLALIAPVLVVNHVRSHSVQFGRSLEIPKLSAVLPSPRSATIVDINFCGHYFGVGCCGVACWRVTECSCDFNHCFKNVRVRQGNQWTDRFTKAFSMSILNLPCREISDVGHKVSCRHTLSISSDNNIVYCVWEPLVS